MSCVSYWSIKLMMWRLEMERDGTPPDVVEAVCDAIEWQCRLFDAKARR